MSSSQSADIIAAEIAATRDRLIANLDDLSVRVQPEHIVSNQVQRVKNFYLDDFGGIRMDRAAKTAGVVFGLAIIRKIFR